MPGAQHWTLHDGQLKKVGELLTQNESAITALVNAAIALADIKTGKSYSSVDVETAMAELETLAKRAKNINSCLI